MVYKRSEYGHQFKVSTLVRNLPVYEEYFNYRHLRRERECAHTPISWDGETIEYSESDEKVCPDVEVDKLPVSELMISEENEEQDSENDEIDIEDMNEEQTKQDVDDMAREKKLAQRRDARRQVTQMVDNDVEIVKQNDELRKSAKQKLNNYVSNMNKDQPSTSKAVVEKKIMCKTFVKPKPADDKLFLKQGKPRHPERQNKIPRARPQSAPSARPLSQGVKTSEPFLNYGCGSRERSTGNKKTFNVRASSAVYPAALRAKKRSLLLIEKQIERQRTASAREKRRKAKFNERMSRETAHWETEYHRCYPVYDNTEYATSDKDPRKRKSFFLT